MSAENNLYDFPLGLVEDLRCSPDVLDRLPLERSCGIVHVGLRNEVLKAYGLERVAGKFTPRRGGRTFDDLVFLEHRMDFRNPLTYPVPVTASLPSELPPEILAGPHLLKRGLESDPEAPALISPGVRWSWRELDERSTRLAAGLLALGLKPGDRLASLLPNCPSLVVHYLACFKSGIVATPLNYRYMPPEIDHALGVSQASSLLVHADRLPDLAPSKLAGNLPLGQILHGAKAEAGPHFEDLVHTELPASLPPGPKLSDPAVIFFTSGSTGLPKGVTHTQRTTAWMFANAAAGLELTSSDRMLAASSLSHVGAFYLTFAALSVGAPIVVPRTLDGDELLPLLHGERPTVLSMLPSALFALTRDHNATQETFASLRLCRSAGDTVAAELEREFTTLTGLTIDEAYGMCETGIITINPPSGRIIIGSVGQPVPNVSLSVRSEDGRDLQAGNEGRVWILSPASTVGYWDNPKATGELFRDGWLDSGDVMRADADGYYYFRGRKKQIIVHDGSNISPQEIEGVLLEHPSVESAGVIGIHDLVHGENVRAYVTVKEGTERPTSQELIRFARSKVGYKAPDEIVFLDTMPQTASGKVNRTELKRMAEENIHRGPDSRQALDFFMGFWNALTKARGAVRASAMANSWVRNTLLAGCLSLAFSPLAKAGLVLVPSNLPTLGFQTFVTVDFDTQAFAVGSYVSGYDFIIQSNGAANPESIVGSNGSNTSFSISSANLGLLGTGVTVDANLVSSNPGSSFQQYAYFSPTPSAGTYYLGFQTTADIDQNPGTSGPTYGFFEIVVGSMTVVGYGFESTPGVGAVTTPVPEPVVGTLVALALGGVVVGRRRYLRA